MAEIDMLVDVGEKEKEKLFEERLNQLFEQSVMVNGHSINPL
ncbi:hypothetical protein TGS27_2324 [Geobacillus stearothermophilus]|nr:hypothetical protein TGS27_2324 [Geobacillus stearothermophilus]